MHRFQAGCILSMLLAGCATTSKPSGSLAPERAATTGVQCRREQPKLLRDLLEQLCACARDAETCELLATLLEREGGADDLAHAGELRRAACEMGSKASCLSPPPAAK
jgi:hypothetical protein